MTILVTGGAGFIGTNFVREWLRHSTERVVNYDKLTYAGNAENLNDLVSDERYRFVHGDICDVDVFAGTLAQEKPRAVLNFAAESHVDRSIHGPEDFVQTNVVGVSRLLQASLHYWRNLRVGADRDAFRFLQVSTDEVYGTLTPGAPLFTEDSRYEPNSPYAATKAASDHLVRAWGVTFGLPVLTTNCSNNYGPYQFPEKLIPLVIGNSLAGCDLPVYGDGMQVRDWLFVSDHCTALRAVLESGRVGDTYNIGGLNEITNIAVVHAICGILDELSPAASGIPYSTQIRHVTDRPGHDRRYAIDATKIRTTLNWRPAETFATGLRKTVKWYLANTAWLDRVRSGAYRDWLARHYDA